MYPNITELSITSNSIIITYNNFTDIKMDLFKAVNLYLTDKAQAITRYGYIDKWNTSNVTNMKGLFANTDYYNSLKGTVKGYYLKGVRQFNEDISGWDTTKVTDLSSMFYGNFSSGLFAKSFNQPLKSWNVSKVTDMHYMFKNVALFNQPLDNWNVSEVNNMYYMFYNVINFNQSLNSWNVSKVTGMRWMFNNAENFNQPLKNWNISKVNNMSYMLSGAINFNQDLSTWTTNSKADNNINSFACDAPILEYNIYYPKSSKNVPFTKTELCFHN